MNQELADQSILLHAEKGSIQQFYLYTT